MRTNPVADVFAFLTGPSYHEPSWMHFLYWVVALTSLAVATIAAERVPGQLTVSHLGRFVIRFIVGSMWWQQALWKFPTDLGGLKYWTEQIAAHAAFQFHREFVQHVILPHFTPIGVAVFFIEILNRDFPDDRAPDEVKRIRRRPVYRQSLARPLPGRLRVAMGLLLSHHAPGDLLLRRLRALVGV